MPTETARVDGSKFRAIFVLLLVLGITAIFLAVIWPFLQTLLLAAVLSGLFHPFFNFVVRICRGRRSLASALTLLLLFLLIVGPLSAFVGIVVQQAINVSDTAIPWLQQHFGSATSFDVHSWVVTKFPLIADFVPSQQEILNSVGTATKAAGGFLVSGASSVTAGTAGFVLHFFVMIYAMFFFLKDGRKILEKIFYYMPLSHDDELRMLDRFVSVTRATIKGTLLIGLIQGVLAGIAFYFAGIDGAAFWGTIMVILSVVPGIGAALVWIPAVVYLYLSGQALAATLLGLWCAAVVGTIDNVLRPTLVGKDAEMPDLLILIGTLGGLFFFGPFGFIVGPIVCGLFLTVWDIYGAAFKDVLPEARDLKTGKAIDPPINVRPKDEEPKAARPSRRQRSSPRR